MRGNEVRGMYSQYIGELNYISTYAANDLTPRGVAGMRDPVQHAERTAQDLRIAWRSSMPAPRWACHLMADRCAAGGKRQQQGVGPAGRWHDASGQPDDSAS